MSTLVNSRQKRRKKRDGWRRRVTSEFKGEKRVKCGKKKKIRKKKRGEEKGRKEARMEAIE